MFIFFGINRIVELWAAIKARFLGAKNASGYYGIVLPGNDDGSWVRTTNNGLLPYKAGGSSALGTSSWPFMTTYSNAYYEGGVLLSSKYAAASHAHAVMGGATSAKAGTAGLVPAPIAGAATRYLRSDGAWVLPPDTNTTYAVMTGATASSAGKSGLTPVPAAGAMSLFLCADGTWRAPPSGGGVDYRPKGSVYLTKGSESPAALFGGTWTKRTDTYLFMGYKIWERVS